MYQGYPCTMIGSACLDYLSSSTKFFANFSFLKNIHVHVSWSIQTSLKVSKLLTGIIYKTLLEWHGSKSLKWSLPSMLYTTVSFEFFLDNLDNCREGILYKVMYNKQPVILSVTLVSFYLFAISWSQTCSQTWSIINLYSIPVNLILLLGIVCCPTLSLHLHISE